jgi:hypothetical protein
VEASTVETKAAFLSLAGGAWAGPCCCCDEPPPPESTPMVVSGLMPNTPQPISASTMVPMPMLRPPMPKPPPPPLRRSSTLSDSR